MQLSSAVLHWKLFLKATLLSEECYTYDKFTIKRILYHSAILHHALEWWMSALCIKTLLLFIYIDMKVGSLSNPCYFCSALESNITCHLLHTFTTNLWAPGNHPASMEEISNLSLCRFANVSMKHDILFSGTSQVSRFRMFVLATIFVSLLNNFGA